mgnify:CR=1 FL=1
MFLGGWPSLHPFGRNHMRREVIGEELAEFKLSIPHEYV